MPLPEDDIFSLMQTPPSNPESRAAGLAQFLEYLPAGRRRFVLSPLALKAFPRDRDFGIYLCFDVIRLILGTTAMKLPSLQYLESLYLRHLKIDEDITPFIDIVMLCNKIAIYYLLKKDFVKALDWLHEVEKIYSCQEFLHFPRHLPWEVRLFAPPCLEYSTLRMSTCYIFSSIFSELSNTAAASYYAYFGHYIIPYLYRDVVPEIEGQRMLLEYKSKCSQRHPSLNLIVKWDVTVPELQARGTWTRLSSMPNKAHIARFSCSIFNWKSRLYVFGGTQHHHKGNYDFSYCDLVKMGGWNRLRGLSIPAPGSKMKLYKNRAYVFTGSQMYYYDLEKRSWTLVTPNGMSRKDKPWPYADYCYLQNYCMEIFEDKIYIFGGGSYDAPLGTNILMMFDINTQLWTHLSGNSDARGTMVMPQFRVDASSWIVPRQRKMYILYGRVQRQALQDDHPERSNCDWNYDDLWSYHLDERIWRRECIRGNFPSPRAYMGHVYHPTMDKAIVFGGYSDTVPTFDDDEPELPFAYSILGDTFIFDPDTNIWKHILTREFPTYRMGSSIAVDPDTGLTYLFGGTTCNIFVPSKTKHSSPNRIFGDIWRLDIDVPSGGNFDRTKFYKNMDVERVKRSAWIRHKELHHCRKKDKDLSMSLDDEPDGRIEVTDNVMSEIVEHLMAKDRDPSISLSQHLEIFDITNARS